MDERSNEPSIEETVEGAESSATQDSQWDITFIGKLPTTWKARLKKQREQHPEAAGSDEAEPDR